MDDDMKAKLGGSMNLAAPIPGRKQPRGSAKGAPAPWDGVQGQSRNIPTGDKAAQRHRKVLHANDVERQGYCDGCGETDDCLGKYESDHD